MLAEELAINKKDWKAMSKEELSNYKNKLFKFYKENGFPYYPTDEKYRKAQFNRLKKTNPKHIGEDKFLKQFMVGLNLAWSYFPHAFSVKCNGLLSPKEVFDNDELFKKVIEKRLMRGDNMSDSGIRKTLRIFTGAQSVSNFRPTVATYLYNKYAKDGVVWDMSCGFGGRLLGFMVSEAKKYIGTEPCELTYKGLIQLKEDYENIFSQTNTISLFGEEPLKEIKINKMGSEDYLPQKESLDFCFTSPPYFDTEKYSEEENQSYKKYPTKETWLNGFLKTTFKNCFYGLKKGKYMAINIANVKSFPDLEKKTIEIAKEVGFVHEDTLYYLLSSLSKDNKFKKEPVFIFKK